MSHPTPHGSDHQGWPISPPAAYRPQFEDKQRYVICATCHQLRSTTWPGQLCSCATSEQADALRAVKNNNWIHEIELCRCCVAVSVWCSTKFSGWFCDDCQASVASLNEKKAGGCVIPRGWHSVLNGVALKSTTSIGPSTFQAFADQLGASFRQGERMGRYAHDRLVLLCHQFGFVEGADVSLTDYEAAAERAGLTEAAAKHAAFAEFAHEIRFPLPDAEET